MTEPWLIALLTNGVVLVLALLALWGWSLKITWGISEVKEEIVRLINDHGDDDHVEFGKLRDEIGKAYHDFGETVAALKQKIGDVELHAAQVYVQRDGFHKSVDALTASIGSLRQEIKDDLLRMEKKLDQKT